MSREKISATIITFNEEKNIERCLKSLQWIDEIIIVDSYSTDKTVEICEKYGCVLIQTDWRGFGNTKKYAVDNASNDWIFSIDADEEVSEQLRLEIEDVLKNPLLNAYKVKRNSFYLGKEVKYCGWHKDYPLRLFNRKFGNFNDKEVHESVVINGEKGRIEAPLYHYTYPTISSHISKINRYSELAQSDIGKKKYGIIISLFLGVNKFIKMYVLQKGIMDGKVGFLLSLHSAFGVYLKYIKTWQKN